MGETDTLSAAADDDDEPGPITSGMILTALISCRKDRRSDIRQHVDFELLTSIINGWLDPVERPSEGGR
jgi:hypothetical protein